MAFKNGNITRVEIENFLTFDHVTVLPTPYLNLIIGPNGTGKSTILCAICICLGGKPEVTGRSKNIDNFVKHGKDAASVEVELHNENGPNKIIRRKFGRGGTKFFLQGKPTTKNVIDSVISKFSIQVDNLCQFLPQDRVANFARMNSIQLLEATEKAVGEPSLFEHHELLRDSGSKMQDIKTKYLEVSSQLDALVKQNARLKDIVENVQEKERIEEEIKEYEQQMIYFTYNAKRNAVNVCNENLKTINSVIKGEEAKIKSVEKGLDVIKESRKVKRKILHDKSMKFQSNSEKCNQLLTQIAKLSEKIKDLKSDYQSKKEESEQRRRDVEDFRKQLDVFEHQLQSLPAVNEKEIAQRIQKLTSDIQETSRKMAVNTHEQDEIADKRKDAERKVRDCQARIAAEQNVMQQRMELLRQRNNDAYRAAEWLKSNANKFSAPFYMPICTLLNIKDPIYASAVESSINYSDLVAFVFEDKDDMNKFKSMMDKQRIRVNIVHSVPLDLSTFKPPVPIDNLRRWGFNVYMSDLVDAPPAILAYLYKNNGLYCIPITSREHIAYEELPDRISFFFMGSLRVSRSRSRYDGEVITEIIKIKDGSLLKIVINQNRINELEHNIATCEKDIVLGDKRKKILEEEEKEMKSLLEKWRNEKQGHTSRAHERNVLLNRIKHKSDQIARYESDSFDIENEEKVMQTKIDATLKAMVSLVQKGGEIVSTPVSHTQEYYKMVSDLKLMNVFEKTKTELLSTIKEELRSHEERYKKEERDKLSLKKEATKALQDLCKSFGVNSHANIPQSTIRRYNEMTIEETEQKLADLSARRECIHTADEGEINDYNDRELRIAELRKEGDRLKLKRDNQYQQLEKSRLRWLPCVKELIQNISSSFTDFMERMGCAGEVELTHGEDENDYSKYGISIYVKFRGVDKLRVLTAQHQSGGERAVATALYMLSLQNLTAVPFRCVDEINQGMDPINERLMLSMLMETAAKEESSQYFFVSPKLLPDLEYSDRVNTIVVYNGPVLVPENTFNLDKILKRKKNRRD